MNKNAPTTNKNVYALFQKGPTVPGIIMLKKSNQ